MSEVSQFGQDRLVIELLGGLRGGFFLDVGASDGVDCSNTLLLERAFGWTGLCVEANDRTYRRLIANRACVCLNACLYDRVGDLPFLEAAGALGGVIADFEPGQLDFAVSAEEIPLDADGSPPLVTKRTMMLAEALKIADAPPVIDYWSLDTEGSELRLLESFPFDRHVFNVLTVEHNNQPARFPIRRFLESRGFELVASLVIDDCYVRAAALPGRRARRSAWRRMGLGL